MFRSMKSKGKCECKPVVGVLGMILLAAGIYFLVWGFKVQMATIISWGSWSWKAILFYLVGLFLVGFGKMLKYKGYECCTVHSMIKK